MTSELLTALVQRRPLTARIALVVAHPDDETIGAGGALHLFTNLLLIHVTDGAPRGLADACANGFATAAAYADARRNELAAALETGSFSGRRSELGIADQTASLHMAAIAGRLVRLFNEHDTTIILTHAYEGGHPDHDATAFAVHTAARRCSSAPQIFEMAGYHAAADGSMATARFLPNGPESLRIELSASDGARKRKMLDCFTSQRKTLAAFGVEAESFRPAPTYDFAEPPHDGPLHYDRFDWGMTGERWRALAAAARGAAAS